ncbi:MAG: NDMA-dependent alcohol dehydrogenase [Ilumatobacteraceae bacterium]
MKMKAAILWAPKTEWSVEEVELDPPKAGEVLVKLVGSGLCHSDEHLLTGDLALPDGALDDMGITQFPLIGGHEGAGEVMEVGPGVTALQPGDHVVFGFIPSCGRCPSCSTGHQNLCDLGQYLLAGRQVTDFTARHHAKGHDLGLMCCIGTFGEYTVASEASCIKIDNDIPLQTAALVGCGVTTGWGSAVYAAEVKTGETVVVVGCGGVGMNAVQGASMAGARHVIAVDPVEFKREHSQIFGATHSAASMEEATALVSDLTWGAMANKVILTMGVAAGEYIQPALAMTAKGGRVVQTAIAPFSVDSVSMNLFELAMYEKQLVGSIFGSANPRRDIPRLLRMHQEGQLKLEELVTRTYPLEQINEGYQDMRDGKNIRGMVMYDHSS